MLQLSSAVDTPVQRLDVKTFSQQVIDQHPMANRARLATKYAELERLRARSLTEPGFALKYDRKTFDAKNYWNVLGSELSLPTLYGIEFYGNYDLNSGNFLNPEQSVPVNGLYAGGIKVPLGNGLWQSKMRFERNRANRLIDRAPFETQEQYNDLLEKALEQYYRWVEAYWVFEVNEQAAQLSGQQFSIVKTAAMLGERPIIDTVESHMQWQSRLLAASESKMLVEKNLNLLLQFIWDQNMLTRLKAYELIPPSFQEMNEQSWLLDSSVNQNNWRSQNPVLQQIDVDIQVMNLEYRYKRNQLLPKAEFKYNLLYNPDQ
ncbi:MAG: hypothetical protein LPK45_05580, partial [Bacteroidota bacterium]|nr:hypothetical protein [Bacteroidota bacterium]MDX5430538.1 hypothetical protein [Bacteroidota bacterium]MDX5469291.1 hypothetical protein [Bacteroidota bacterium]